MSLKAEHSQSADLGRPREYGMASLKRAFPSRPPSATSYRMILRHRLRDDDPTLHREPFPARKRDDDTDDVDGPASCTCIAGDAATRIGSVVGGKYMIRSLLGQGGASSVFEAEHVELETPVALKLMHPELADAPSATQHFRREARLAARIVHPNVVRVVDAGEYEGGYYIAMERLVGISLRAWLDRVHGLPSLAQVGEIIDQVLSGLEALHRHGIVHRDVKPQNLVLARDDSGEQTVKIVDFGIAQCDEQDVGATTLPSAGVFEGTPEYMSPEQCIALPTTPKADLYAVGCVLTELLQKRPPFGGMRPFEVIRMHVNSGVPQLARPADAEEVPEALESLRLSLLAKDPQRRPRDAREARRLLAEALGTSTRPVSGWRSRHTHEKKLFSSPSAPPIANETPVVELRGNAR